MNKVTNKDAKIIYSKYWHKNMGFESFPTIYIDEYWEYTIDLFSLRENWEWFLKKFNEEFHSAREYIEESERVKDILIEKYCTSDANEKLKNYVIKDYHFPLKNTYDIPDGEYWVIDLKEAFNQALYYVDTVNPGVTYDGVIKEATSSELIQMSKVLRVQMYYKLKNPFKNIMYHICDEILYNLSQDSEFKNMVHYDDIICICGDSLYIPVEKSTLKEGDYEMSGISFHVKKKHIMSVQYKGETIKWLETNSVNFFYRNNYPQYVSIDEYLCLMKTIKNQQPNQIDLTVGFEEQIFYVMDN